MPTSPELELIDFYRPHAERFEGRSRWMYLDTEGNVTVGIGHMIPTEEAAYALPWEPGTAFVEEDWLRVNAAQPGLVYTKYRELSQARLVDASIDALFLDDAMGKIFQVRKVLPQFDAMPLPARAALLDMTFNMGPKTLRSEFLAPGRKFGPALLAGNYQIAAKESARLGIRDERNQWTADQLRSAA